MKIFVIGDIHGAYKALLQCLQRSSFDYDKDRLIALGDVCDGWSEVQECIDELLKIKHCDYIIGNHDLWTLDWALTGRKERAWLNQGGRNTIMSYEGRPIPKAHIKFFKDAHFWLEVENKLFVHGGFDPDKPIHDQDKEALVWDRLLINEAWDKHSLGSNRKYGRYDGIFVGHTPTSRFGSKVPVHCCNLWDLDTGAGWSGCLTIMDIHTKQFWQSDPTPELYPDSLGRNFDSG